MAPRPIIILAGPTASGKSQAAIAIAKKYGGVIINADAMQVYAEIPVLSAQPTKAEQQGVPHYLYGVLPGSESCSAAKWVEFARPVIDKAHQEGRLPIVAGGTGLYLKSLIEGLSPIPDITLEIRDSTREQMHQLGAPAFHGELKKCDPAMASRLRPSDTQRLIRAMEVWKQTGVSLAEWQAKQPVLPYPEAQFLTLFLHPERKWLYSRCDKRFLAMLEDGGIEEAKALMALGHDPALPVMKALGVPQLLAYLRGESTREAAVSAAQQSTRNYAKRQITWFKHQLKEAKEITYNDFFVSQKHITGMVDQFVRTPSPRKDL